MQLTATQLPLFGSRVWQAVQVLLQVPLAGSQVWQGGQVIAAQLPPPQVWQAGHCATQLVPLQHWPAVQVGWHWPLWQTLQPLHCETQVPSVEQVSQGPQQRAVPLGAWQRALVAVWHCRQRRRQARRRAVG